MIALEIRELPGTLIDFASQESARCGVPGTAIGVLHDSAIFVGAVGVTNVEAPQPVTPDTLFQIGSTSKTFTATALMQLVEEGAVDLDRTVRSYLPEFRLQSEVDAARITLRDLVTHHGGFVGDYFRDTGRGDDAIGAIVRKMANSPQLVPAGTTFSYSNAGFYVLGHVIERLRGIPFERVVAERIFAPLGMRESFYFPEDCMTRRFVVGHIAGATDARVARRWHTPRSIAPGGGITSNAIDQLRYAALHTGTVAAPSVLAAHTVRGMQQPQRAAGSMCDAIGISWMLDDAGEGHRLVKHGGSTNGQLSSFELVPSCGFAVTVLTNADAGRTTRQTIADACQRHFLGFDKPELPLATDHRPELSEYGGDYLATLVALTVTVDQSDALIVTERALVDVADKPAGEPARLGFVAPDRAVITNGPRKGERVEFLRERGAVAWLRWDGRIARRQNR
jgi:CubicO group peptidase (beta-lactamase class C family)